MIYHTYLKGFHISHLFLVWFFVYHPHHTSRSFCLTCLTSHIALEFIFYFLYEPYVFWHDCLLCPYSTAVVFYINPRFWVWLYTWYRISDVFFKVYPLFCRMTVYHMNGMSRFSSTFVLYFVVWLSTIHKTCQRFSTVTFHFVVWLYRNMVYTLFYSMAVHCRYDISDFFYIYLHFVVRQSMTYALFCSMTVYHTYDISKVFYIYPFFCW